MFAVATILALIMQANISSASLLARADRSLEGTIVAVQTESSGAAGTLVITDKGAKTERRLMVGREAKITLNNEAAKFGDLNTGDVVRILTDAGGRIVDISAMRGKTFQTWKSRLPTLPVFRR